MDVITHVTDLTAFRLECVALIGELDVEGDLKVPELSYDAETETLIYGVTKIPVVYGDNETLCLLRVADDSQLEHFEYMVRLGEFTNGDYVFDSDVDQAVYERVRGPLEVAYTDDEGQERTYYKPYMIGIFA